MSSLWERSHSSSGCREPRRNWQFLALVVVAAACSDGGPAVPVRVSIEPGVALLDSLGERVRFVSRWYDREGAPVHGVVATWTSSDTAVATIDAVSGLAVARSTGTTSVTVTALELSGTVSLEVYITEPKDYQAGERYFGRRSYVEYQAGDLPIVLSVPHGGYLEPEEIQDRTWGTLGRDRNTQELARTVADSLAVATGGSVHLIISRLHRLKLDPNREIVEAAQGDPFAEHAWDEFHDFIEHARGTIAADHGRGLYVDLHGHGHSNQRLELGYLLTASDLMRSDAELNAQEFAAKASIRTLAEDTDSSFASLVRGVSSLGGLLQAHGFPAVPSPQYPDPGGEPFFSGGHNTAQHGARDGGAVSGAQLEMNWTGVRDETTNHEIFAGALVTALQSYFEIHFGTVLPSATSQMAVRAFRVRQVIR